MEPLLRLAYRSLFVLAGTGLILALAEGLIGLTGRSLVGHEYSAGRLLEISTMLMVFVIGLRLRQPRE
ncbi:MAG: hypothetical protein CMLOHMNK_01452 [Steroidobacteraceae bacterium]|nr:hypothetical protein [Steroidobacteraceae bacterium]